MLYPRAQDLASRGYDLLYSTNRPKPLPFGKGCLISPWHLNVDAQGIHLSRHQQNSWNRLCHIFSHRPISRTSLSLCTRWITFSKILHAAISDHMACSALTSRPAAVLYVPAWMRMTMYCEFGLRLKASSRRWCSG
jgi:hypothetical protein